MAEEKEELLEKQEEAVIESNDEKVLMSEEQINEAVGQMSDREAIETYLSDPKVTSNLRKWAEMFQTKFRGNWFTTDKIIKKTRVKSPDEIAQIMGFLILKGYCVQKNDNGVIKFKITLDPENRLKLLEEHREVVKAQLDAVDREIEKLKAEIGNSK